MARAWASICWLQLVACLLGFLSGFVPGVSFTSSFWGLYTSQVGAGPVRVDQVTRGSPADKAGFRAGDAIQHPEGFDGVHRALRELRPGEKHVFTVQRDAKKLALEVKGVSPQLAAVWYADLWYPIAGALFLAIGLFVFATAPLEPAPLWRSIPVAVAGLGISAEFSVAVATDSIFSRFLVWQRWSMGDGKEWYFEQGFIGIAAGILLAILAAAEIRHGLTRSPAKA